MSRGAHHLKILPPSKRVGPAALMALGFVLIVHGAAAGCPVAALLGLAFFTGGDLWMSRLWERAKAEHAISAIDCSYEQAIINRGDDTGGDG
jgi:hypothetical protein